MTWQLRTRFLAQNDIAFASFASESMSHLEVISGGTAGKTISTNTHLPPIFRSGWQSREFCDSCAVLSPTLTRATAEACWAANQALGLLEHKTRGLPQAPSTKANVPAQCYLRTFVPSFEGTKEGTFITFLKKKHAWTRRQTVWCPWFQTETKNT